MNDKLEPIHRINEINESNFPRAESVKYTLIGDIIYELSLKNTDLGSVYRTINEIFSNSEIVATGFLTICFWSDEREDKKLDYKTIIPSYEWKDLCECNSSGVGEMFYDDDRKLYYNEYRSCNWHASKFSYYAWETYIEDDEEFYTWERMTVEWTNVQIPESSRSDLLKAIDYKLAPHSRPNYIKAIPSNDAIIRKAKQMKADGLNRDNIAKKMKFEVGFESVPNTLVRELTKGLWKPGPQKNN